MSNAKNKREAQIKVLKALQPMMELDVAELGLALGMHRTTVRRYWNKEKEAKRG